MKYLQESIGNGILRFSVPWKERSWYEIGLYFLKRGSEDITQIMIGNMIIIGDTIFERDVNRYNDLSKFLKYLFYRKYRCKDDQFDLILSNNSCFTVRDSVNKVTINFQFSEKSRLYPYAFDSVVKYLNLKNSDKSHHNPNS